MRTIGEVGFGLILLALGVVSIANPSGVRLFAERFGGRSWFSERTVHRSIRISGIIAIVMAAIVFGVLMYGR